jgi:hypothetical protein
MNMNPLEKYLASCSPGITNILDTYLANRRLEEQYQDVDSDSDSDSDSFGDDLPESMAMGLEVEEEKKKGKR